MSEKRIPRRRPAFFIPAVLLLFGCSILGTSAVSPTAMVTSTPRPPTDTLTAAPPSATPSPALPTDTPAKLTPDAWLAAHAVPFSTTDPDSGAADLAFVKTAVGDARIVSLGEATHGTHEFFAMKRRIWEYLAEEMGFTIFAIETNMPDAELVNEYVLTGRGDPASMLSRFHWPWNTQEVLDLVEWMREYNETRGESAPVYFAGFDMQESWDASGNVLEYVQSVDPGEAESFTRYYACLRKYGDDFGWITSAYPKEPAEARKECRNNLQAAYNILGERRIQYMERSSVREFDWAWQSAKLVLQFEEMLCTYGKTRDRDMAENVSWLADTYYPGARMVLWAHNLHVSKSANFQAMGYHLRNRYGPEIVNFGFSFYRGGFNAVRKFPNGAFGGMTVFELDGPFPDGIENAFHPIGDPGFFLDMRGIETDPGAAWLFRKSRVNFSGAVFDAEGRSYENLTMVLPQDFDVLIHVDATTPTRLLGQWGSIPVIRVARVGPTPTPNPLEGSGTFLWDFETGMAPWGLSGDPVTSYRAEIDRTIAHGGQASARLQSVDSSARNGFGTLIYMLPAAMYRGKTVRFSGFLRAEDVSQFAGLWIRVDKANEVLAFLKSLDQPVSGDTDWKQIRLEMKVPNNGDAIYFGVILEGEGSLWMDDLRVESV